ncbi:hypothetical protein [Succinatimonas hippei]|uniref:hypothetical protein n=1 Tax=Succinatimonas hippei TaxID=626938 RepID=UPI002490994C|nr:hypothetical protein [Succinatimonas hippei]
MEQIVASLIKIISRYEFLNNLIPGIILCLIFKYIGYNFTDDNWLTNLVIYYFIGLVNSRISSLSIEYLCRKTSFIEWRNYSSYNNAKNKRPYLATMQEIANMYRSMASVFMITLLAILYKQIANYCLWLNNNGYWIICILLFVLFIFSYRKQVNYIVKNIDELDNDKKCSN